MFKKLLGYSTTGLNFVYIDTTGYCTNKCYMCAARSAKKLRDIMSDETFILIIQKLKEIKYRGEIHLYGQNEPLLDKKLFDKIEYITQELPKVKIALISNLTILNDEIINKLIKSPISYFSHSIYAFKEDSYKIICGKDNFQKSFINHIKLVKRLCQYENFKFSYGLYLMENENIKDDIEFCKFYLKEIVPVSYTQINNTLTFFSSTHNKLKRKRFSFTSCIEDKIKIVANGDISICTTDPDSLMKIGNINDLENKNIYSIFNGKNARKIRRKMIYSLFDKTSYCQFCSCGRQLKKEINYIKLDKELLNKKIINFNQIFKDNDEDNWKDCLEKLRREFYANKK